MSKIVHASLILLIGVAMNCNRTIDYEEPPVDQKNPVVKMETSKGDIYLELFEQDAPETVANFVGLAEGSKEFTDPQSGDKTKRPYYDGLTFHRVIDGFMIQGGCPLGTGTGDPGYKFRDEINAESLGLDTIMVAEAPYAQRDAQMYTFEKLGISSQEELDARLEEVKDEFNRVAVMPLVDLYTSVGYTYDSHLTSHKAVRGVIAMANAGPNTNGSQFFITHGDTPWLDGKHTVFGKVVKGMAVVDSIAKTEVEPGSNRPLEAVTIRTVRVVKQGDHQE